ncbi:MAG: AMP-binding protein [Deltaproteobacteria bacterium]|nr:AMP-binding protein [Deltaproteobacteria bacterium]MBW1924883.1 AMP-binding protein [Deltaproteobacteria bacterium]MBW1950050.1 AMP-binding protein [Deltaproteobacteria bacterium]MBW2007973.1 AMP-binding protein [Deltaproteobacteria bacterium]RLB38779.1 MAG: long-chain fatty acid--CoA ligase [Deltaproteobacteria bacterium]
MKEDTLPKLFLRNRNRYGDRQVALREKDLGIWQCVTWRQYWDHVCFFALGLRTLGLKPGDKVSVLGDNCREWLYADLAAQGSSAVTVGIYPTDVASQVKYILENSETVFVVVKDQEQADKVMEVKEELPLLKKIIVIDMKGMRRYKDPMIISFEAVEKLGEELHSKEPGLFEEMVQGTRPEDVGIIVYTSGTTGRPKGAMITQKNMMTMIQGLSQVLEFREGDSFVSALPLCHIAERMFSLIFPMWAGCTVNFAESVATLQEDMKEISPSAFLNVPRIWEKIHSNIHIRMQDAVFFKRWIFNAMMPIGRRVAEYKLRFEPVPFLWKVLNGIAYLLLFRSLRNQLGLLEARILVSGAAPLSVDIMKFFHAIGLPIRECYGMTEMSGISFMPRDGEIQVGGVVGKAIPGVEVTIAEDGEILQRGDSVFAGYYGNPDATKEAIRDGWLHTGDVGEVDEEGNLKITDRKKDLIITAGGKNIAPSEIENKLKFSPFINEAIVIGDRRKYLTCLIQIELQNVENWAQRNKIAYTNYKSLATHPEVYKLIQGEVEEANRHFARVETIKKFAILDKELDPDDQEVTATMKVKRAMIEKKFGDLIESLY